MVENSGIGMAFSRRPGLEAMLVTIVIFLGLLPALDDYAVVWDEGMNFERQDALRPWLRLAARGEWGRLLDPDLLERHWRFSRAEPDGHGPFYCLLSLASQSLFHAWFEPPASYRVLPMGLFALAIGCVFGTLRRRWALVPSLVAVGLLVTLPRVLPEVCFALVDGPLYSLALLTWCGFVRLTEPSRRLGWLTFGIPLGLAMATKLTGWLLVAPYLAWMVWMLDKRVALRGLAGLAVAGVVVLAINVGWWPDPWGGLMGFFQSNLSREETIAIGIQFMGKRYTFDLPPWNTVVWTGVAMPPATVALGLAGIVAVFRRFRPEPFGLLLLLNWGLLMGVRAMPKVPGHDGTRQIIIAFGFLALLAGYGFAVLWQQTARTGRRGARLVAAVVGGAAVAASAADAYRYHPLQLSYYSPLIGGLAGAERLGFEPTYFWDAVTPEVLDWLHANTGPHDWVLFRNNSPSWDYLARWGKLRVRFRPPASGQPPRWIVYQHRPGIFTPGDDRLIANGTPAFRKSLFGVPLISIYSYDETLRVANP